MTDEAMLRDDRPHPSELMNEERGDRALLMLAYCK
jgi:hypothetical protein